MKKENLKVGQDVYLEPTGNATRYQKGVIKTKIKTIGKKYFTVEEKYLPMTRDARFEIESMRHDEGEYCSNYNAYLSMKEIEDKEKRPELLKSIQERFSKFSVDELREIEDYIVHLEIKKNKNG